MKVTKFNPHRDLIFVPGRVWGSRGEARRRLRLVLDTGAAETILIPEVLDELGYSPRDGEQITVMRSAVGREHGYMARVARLTCLGHREDDCRVHVQDLPEDWEIDGLLGVTFLRRFNYEIRPAEGRILVERIAI